MTQAISSATRAARWLFAAAALCFASPRLLAAQTPTPPASGFTVLEGTVVDSVHGVPLAGAHVEVEGTGRHGTTTAEGQYRIDSIPPGKHRVTVSDPLLDTLGVAIRTPEYPFDAGGMHNLDLVVPSGAQLVGAFCTTAQRYRGPAVIVGFVRDPDSKAPVVGAKVEVAYDRSDPIGRKLPSLGSAIVDSSGLYHICGLPADMSGKIQVFIKGVSSGEVPVTIENSIALRAFSVATQQTVALVKNDTTGKVQRFVYGTAKLTGRVVNKSGQALGGARVTVQGGGTVAFTKPNGTFTLDSLPAGTQSLEVRKLGYGVQDVPVELASNTPAHTTVTMDDYVQTLAAVRVEAKEDQALSKLGYLGRKQAGMGQFFDGKQIDHASLAFSDVVRIASGVQVLPAGDGHSYVITDARNQNGCVNFYVDGSPYKEMTPGDVDQYVAPSEVVAMEVYHGTETPPEFTTPGSSSCLTFVIWTQARVSTVTKK